MRPSAALFATLMTMLLVPATAHEFSAPGVEIIHPYVKATPPSAKTGAGYISFQAGQEGDRLIGIETPEAAKVELHRNEVVDGIARMRPMTDGLELPPNTRTVLGDDGTHAMFVDIAAPFREGELIEATLVFENAGRVPITFEVEPIAGPSEEDHHHGG